jgi:GlpG protein
MRRVAKFTDEKAADQFSKVLRNQNIEYYLDKEGKEFVFWVKNEDQILLAKKYYDAFLAGTLEKIPEIESDIEKVDIEEALKKIKIEEVRVPQRITFRGTLTKICIILSVAVYCIAFYQRANEGQGGKYIPVMQTTPSIQESLMYDYPKAFTLSNQLNKEYPIDAVGEMATFPPEAKALIEEIQKNPPWIGLYDLVLNWDQRDSYLQAKLFGNILQGQVWRLITPIFLHGDLLHILFNMLWLWLLGKMVENTMRKGTFILFIVIVAVITNTLQYIMTGPLFMGFSGVITALAGYIWVRKKRAPWEILPVDVNTLIFLWVFIFGMLALQIIAFFLQFFHIRFFPMRIANTAHISGLLLGMWMARIRLFQRNI